MKKPLIYVVALVALGGCVGGRNNSLSDPGAGSVSDKGTSEGVGLPGYLINSNSLVLNSSVGTGPGSPTQITIAGGPGTITASGSGENSGTVVLNFWIVPASEWPTSTNNLLTINRPPDVTVDVSSDGSFASTTIQFVSDPSNPSSLLMMPIAASSTAPQSYSLSASNTNLAAAPDLNISLSASGTPAVGVVTPVSPGATPTPTPSTSATQTPSVTPTPTPSDSGTPSPSPSASPTPNPQNSGTPLPGG